MKAIQKATITISILALIISCITLVLAFGR